MHIAGQTSEKALAIAKAADDRSKAADDRSKDADERSKGADAALLQAMVVLINERINEIVDSTKDPDWQLESVGLESPDALLIQPNKRDLAFLQHLADHVASVDLTDEQIAYLAKGPSDVAATITQCIQMRNQLVTDLSGYKGVTMKGMTAEQRTTFPILPSRIRHVRDACTSASHKLATLVPAQFKEETHRGTVGELADAQTEAIMKRRKAPSPPGDQTVARRHPAPPPIPMSAAPLTRRRHQPESKNLVRRICQS